MTGPVLAPNPPLPEPRPTQDTKVVVSWALYDLANTIYYAIVVTAFLPPIFTAKYGSLTPVGVTTSLTLLAAALASPRFGATVDRTGRARPGLDLWTIVCVGFTAVLFFAVEWGPASALLCFAASLFAYQAALTFYNALLPVVAPPGRRGYVSALGTGLGYAGVPVALLLGKAMLGTPLGAPGAFLIAATLMTVGTIPLWLMVKDPDGISLGSDPKLIGFVESLRWVRGQPLLLLLLVANFVSADVANTLIQYATTYFTDFVGMAHGDAINLMIALSVTALAGGLVLGRFADRRPVPIYLGACLALVTGLLGAAFAPGTWWATGWLVVTGGFGVASIWSVGRQLVIRVAPPDRYGTALGLYGITTKASIVGTTVFAILVDAFGYAVAVTSQAVVLCAGILLVVAFGRGLARREAGGMEAA